MPDLKICHQCHHAVDAANKKFLAKQLWVKADPQLKKDPLSAWEVVNASASLDGLEIWGWRCGCHAFQFCGQPCFQLHSDAEEPPAPSDIVTHHREQKAQLEEQELIMLEPMHVASNDVIDTSRRPKPVGSTQTISRKYMQNDTRKVKVCPSRLWKELRDSTGS